MSTPSEKPKLYIEFIPKTCWWSSVRTSLKKNDWDKIRFISYKMAKNKCEICGKTGKSQGYRHDLECHEIWEYDEVKKIQKLKGLISLCPKCHLCVHYGRARTPLKKKECEEHFIKINKWSKKEFLEHYEKVYAEYIDRSKYTWSLDINILSKKPFNIKSNLNKKRTFKKPKKLRRRKRKTKLKNKRPKRL